MKDTGFDSNIGNKIIFSRNLERYMKETGKSRNEICHVLGFKYSTFSEWANGRKYPRIDNIQMLADYFGIQKSDLIEEKKPEDRAVSSHAIFDAKLQKEIENDPQLKKLLVKYLSLKENQKKAIKQAMVTLFNTIDSLAE